MVSFIAEHEGWICRYFLPVMFRYAGSLSLEAGRFGHIGETWTLRTTATAFLLSAFTIHFSRLQDEIYIYMITEL